MDGTCFGKGTHNDQHNLLRKGNTQSFIVSIKIIKCTVKKFCRITTIIVGNFETNYNNCKFLCVCNFVHKFYNNFLICFLHLLCIHCKQIYYKLKYFYLYTAKLQTRENLQPLYQLVSKLPIIIVVILHKFFYSVLSVSDQEKHM